MKSKEVSICMMHLLTVKLQVVFRGQLSFFSLRDSGFFLTVLNGFINQITLLWGKMLRLPVRFSLCLF